LLSRRAARTHLVASRHPKYFLRPRSAGSVSPGSGRPVRHEHRLRPGGSPQTLQTPPHGERPVLRSHIDGPTLRFPRPPAPSEALPPPIGYGPRSGSVRLDFHQQATRPARRALRDGPPLCPASLRSPSRCLPLGVLASATSRGPALRHWPAAPSRRQVPTFHAEAKAELAPPPCRTPPGQSTGTRQAHPEIATPLGFDVV
jgi:hypothetical protein